MRFILNTLLTAIAVAIATFIVPGITPYGSDPWIAYIFVALFLGVVNSFVKPIISFISIPVNIITLGIFQLVINGFMLMLASWLSRNLLDAGISISGIFAALFGSIIISIACSIFGVAAAKED